MGWEPSDLVVRTVANGRRNWLTETAWSGSRTHPVGLKHSPCEMGGRKGQQPRVKAE